MFIILQIFFASVVLKSGNIQSRDTFRAVQRERKYLMDYQFGYQVAEKLIVRYVSAAYQTCLD